MQGIYKPINKWADDMCKNKLIPQVGDKLKELREKTALSQTKFAIKLEQLYYEETQERHGIQQSEVCRLEREEMPVSLKTLLAYTLVGNTKASDLVNGHFNHLLSQPGGLKLHTFTDNDAADQRLYELEKFSRILVSPEFPSSFFRLKKDNKRYQQFNSPDYESMEIYTAESYLNFLFSPVSPYTLNDKTHMLETCIDYFQKSINRNLHFFSIKRLPEFSQLPTMQLLPERKSLLLSAPVNNYQTGDAFIEVNDRKIYNETYRFYRGLPIFENSMICLRIGLEALEKMRNGRPAREAIIFFGREIKRTRDKTAATIISSFSPEIQDMINSEGKECKALATEKPDTQWCL